jgi:hypothetical protein
MASPIQLIPVLAKQICIEEYNHAALEHDSTVHAWPTTASEGNAHTANIKRCMYST